MIVGGPGCGESRQRCRLSRATETARQHGAHSVGPNPERSDGPAPRQNATQERQFGDEFAVTPTAALAVAGPSLSSGFGPTRWVPGARGRHDAIPAQRRRGLTLRIHGSVIEADGRRIGDRPKDRIGARRAWSPERRVRRRRTT